MVQRVIERSTRMLVVRSVDEIVEETEDPSKLPELRPMVEYREDPLGFITHVLGIPEHTIKWSINPGYDRHAWDGTPDPLMAIMDALVASEDVGVESGTGTGKSFLMACLILWFLACWVGARVFTFAPVEKQLREYIWMEISKLWPAFSLAFPTAVLTDLRIRMRGKRDKVWGAQGFAVGIRAGEEVAVTASGQHAEHMLLVYEEAQGVPVATIEAGENTCTAPHNLRVAVGNPDNQLDGLHMFAFDAFGRPREGVRHVQISALDHPNLVCDNPSIVPGAASRKSIKRRRTKYGPTHRLYQSRVRGVSPAEAADALIKLEWIQKAWKRYEDEHDRKILEAQGTKALGVDVANSDDGDEASIARGTGAVLHEVDSFPCPNANNLGASVALEMERESIDDLYVGVDDVGVGAGCWNELARREHYVRAISGGAIGIVGQTEEFLSMRAQAYWMLAEDLRLGTIAMKEDAEAARELTIPTWKTRNSKIVVEAKEAIKDRTPGRKSPNKADSIVYWNFVRERKTLARPVPKREPTRLERIQKEMQALDREEEEMKEHLRGDDRFGSVLRQ